MIAIFSRFSLYIHESNIFCLRLDLKRQRKEHLYIWWKTFHMFAFHDFNKKMKWKWLTRKSPKEKNVQVTRPQFPIRQKKHIFVWKSNFDFWHIFFFIIRNCNKLENNNNSSKKFPHTHIITQWMKNNEILFIFYYFHVEKSC